MPRPETVWRGCTRVSRPSRKDGAREVTPPGWVQSLAVAVVWPPKWLCVSGPARIFIRNPAADMVAARIPVYRSALTGLALGRGEDRSIPRIRVDDVLGPAYKRKMFGMSLGGNQRTQTAA